MGSVLLAGVLLKMGTYGMVRIAVPVLPEGASAVAPYLGALGVVGIVYGSLACLAQRDLKRLVAFSSVGHMGFVLLGIATLTPIGLNGALFANIAHGVITGLLFFLVGGVKDRYGTTDLGELPRSLYARAPRLGGLVALAAVASLGLPGLAGFWGEFLAMAGAFRPAAGLHRSLFLVLLGLAAAGTVLTAYYLLRVRAPGGPGRRHRAAGPRRRRGRGRRVVAAGCARRAAGGAARACCSACPTPSVDRPARGGPVSIQSLDYVALAPVVVLAVGALLTLLVDLALPRRPVLVAAVSFGTVAVALLALLPLRGGSRETFCAAPVPGSPAACSYVADQLAVSVQLVLIAGAGIVVLLSAAERSLPPGELHFLLLSSVAGAATVAAARDLATLVVALELVSLPSFALVALRRDQQAAQAALTAFLMSVVATAVTVLGVAFVYAGTGTLFLQRTATALEHAGRAPAARAGRAGARAGGPRLQARRGAAARLGPGHLPGCSAAGRGVPVGRVQGRRAGGAAGCHPRRVRRRLRARGRRPSRC